MKQYIKHFIQRYLPILMFAFVTLVPFWWMFISSIKSRAALFNTKIFPLFPAEVSLEHFRFLFTKTYFPYWFKNSFFVAGGAAVICLVVSLLAAYGIERIRFPGAKVLGNAIFLSYLVPPIILFIPLGHVLVQLGLRNTLWGLILADQTRLIPFAVWLLMGYFSSIPRELEEVARIDGANWFQVFTQVVLPLSIPGIISATIFSFTLAWSEFLYALAFISTPKKYVIAVGAVTNLIRGDIYAWGPLMAAALLGSLPIALLYALFTKYYVSGMKGAVKY